MRQIILNFGTCSSRQAVHEYLREQFGFPDYYGENLDALYDCLTDFQEDVRICFEDEHTDSRREVFWETEGLEEDRGLRQYLKKVRQVFGDAAEENSHLYL